MAWLKLNTRNKNVIQLDHEDVERVAAYSWSINPKGYVQCNNPYMLLHRFLVNAPKDKQVDHINMNKLDNRKGNLRFCNQSQNSHNAPKKKTNTSGHKGIFFSPSKKWIAKISIDGQRVYLGTFDKKIDAILAYKKYARKVLMDFVNFD